MDVALLLSPEILEVGVLPQNHGQELPETPAPGAPAPSWAATSQLPHPRTQEGAHTGGARTDALLTLMGGCAHSPGLGGGPRAEPTCLWEVCGGGGSTVGVSVRLSRGGGAWQRAAGAGGAGPSLSLLLLGF